MTEFKVGDKIILQGPRHDVPYHGFITKIWPERNAAHVQIESHLFNGMSYQELVNLNELTHATIV